MVRESGGSEAPRPEFGPVNAVDLVPGDVIAQVVPAALNRRDAGQGVGTFGHHFGAEAGAAELVGPCLLALRVADVVVTEGAPRLGAFSELAHHVSMDDHIMLNDGEVRALGPNVAEGFPVRIWTTTDINPDRPGRNGINDLLIPFRPWDVELGH